MAEQRADYGTWDKTLTAELVQIVGDWHKARQIVALISEQRQIADREGYRRGFEQGFEKGCGRRLS